MSGGTEGWPTRQIVHAAKTMTRIFNFSPGWGWRQVLSLLLGRVWVVVFQHKDCDVDDQVRLKAIEEFERIVGTVGILHYGRTHALNIRFSNAESSLLRNRTLVLSSHNVSLRRARSEKRVRLARNEGGGEAVPPFE
jgi:hypothetical protein